MVRKISTGAKIKVYHILLTGDKKILEYDTAETKEKIIFDLNFPNKTAYNEMILLQEETVCFKISEEAKVNIISTEKQEKSG